MNKRRMKSIALGFAAISILLAMVLVPACAQQAPAPSSPTASAPTTSLPTAAPKASTPSAAAPAAVPAGAPAAAKPIKVSMGMDLTGPISGSVLHQFRGGDHYIRMTNDEGGIDGVPIDVMWTDTQYKAPLDLEFYKRARDQGSVLHFMVGTAGGLAVAPVASVDKMAVINQAGDHTFIVPRRTMFSSNSPFSYQSAASVKWFLENWKESRAPKLAWFGWDNPATKGPAELVEKYVKEQLARSDGLKVNWIGGVYTAMRPPDFSTYLLKLKDLNPDLVVIAMDAVDAGALARDAKRLGLSKQWTWTFMTGPNFGVDTVKIAGGDAVDGWLFPSPFESTTGDLPGSVKIREIQNKYQGYVYDDPSYPLGWVSAAIAVEALKLAAKKVGVAKLDRQAVLDAMYAVKDLNTGGLAAPATLSKDKFYALDAVKMWRINNEGKPVPFTDWIKVPRFVPEV